MNLIIMVFARTADHDQDKAVRKEKEELQAEIDKVENCCEIPFNHFGTKADKHVYGKDQERDAEIGENQGYIFYGCSRCFKSDKYFPDDPCTCHTINSEDVQKNEEIEIYG